MSPLGEIVSELPHLSRRFLQVLTARPLEPAEQQLVARYLRPSEHELFWRQPVADQRHGLETAKRVRRSYPADEHVIRAALLHDVGKRHAPIGPLARAMATVADGFRFSLSGRWAVYRDHGRLGAADLEAAGAEPLVVAFAANHGAAAVPTGIDPDRWAALRRADAV